MESTRFKPKFNKEYVSTTFSDRESADKAFRELEERGYKKDEVNVMLSDKSRDLHFSDSNVESDLGDKVGENAGKGSLIGGGIGAVVGALTAIGTNVIFPGLGLVVAGPLAAGLAGAGAGAATGGLIGALTGAGVPEDEAKVYEDRIKEGDIYMGVKPKNQDDARFIYDRWYRNDIV